MRGRAGRERPGRPFASFPYFVQRHWTRQEHFDLHLEVDGRLLGWMLPLAPSFDPSVRRFALRTPDREPEWGRFEGVIPKGEPGEGVVMVWDLGTFEPLPPTGLAPAEWIARGLLRLHLTGERLRGLWELVRTSSAPGTAERWVLVKLPDRHARTGPADEPEPLSAITGRDRSRIEAEAGAPAPRALTARAGPRPVPS